MTVISHFPALTAVITSCDWTMVTEATVESELVGTAPAPMGIRTTLPIFIPRVVCTSNSFA